jgi:SAM-dependent methyltransferase
MRPFLAFVRRWLPPRARVLEVGAGAGRLARELAEHGHDVTPIDRHPPAGSPARPIAVEDFPGHGQFDAVVAERALHHVEDLDRAFASVDRSLDDGGLLLLHEVCWDLLDEPTGRWLHEQTQRLRLDAPADAEQFIRTWRGEHAGLATYPAVRRRLDSGFTELAFAWVPYLAEEYLHDDPAARRAEEDLLRRGEIRAVSFFYAARRRPGAMRV